MSWRNGISVCPSARSAGGVGAGTGAPAGVQGVDTCAVVHQREQVAAHAAQVRAGDGDRRVGGDGRVDRVAAEGERSRSPACVAS